MNIVGRGISVIAGVAILGFAVYEGGNAILKQDPVAKPAMVKTMAPKPVATTASLTQVVAFVPTVAAGKKLSKKCAACHTFNSGGKNKVGPNLFAIMNRKIATNPTFSYSAAFKERQGLVWNKKNLESYLKSPKKFIPGNKMAFAGLKKEKDLKNILMWLETLK